MSVQGYTLTFKPKHDRPRGQSFTASHKRFAELMTEFGDSTSQFMPLGVRARDKAKLEEVDHNASLARLKQSLEDICHRLPFRVICAPGEELKAMQKEIHRQLDRIPIHRNAHGFVRGRDPLTCARSHLDYWGERPKGLVLLNADVQNFFHSITDIAVMTALEKHGVTTENSQAIVDMCMMRADPSLCLETIRQIATALRASRAEINTLIGAVRNVILWDNPLMDRYRHLILRTLMGLGPAVGPASLFLPQGAPTSPTLSNLVCKIIDIRLTAMAKAFGAFYTRYADDLTFSWPAFTKGKQIDGLKRCSAEVFEEYGMKFHPNKVRVIGPGGGQDIVGYMINSGRPTVSQKFRRGIRREIEKERRSKVPTSFTVINRLVGQAGYIQPLHPKEAAWCKEEIGKLAFKTNRKVSSINVPETLEPAISTSRRKVTVCN